MPKMRLRIKLLNLSLLTLILLALASCDSLFVNDGDTDRGISAQGGYFYTADRGAYRIVMLDGTLRELGSWSTVALLDSTDVQGMTFDGRKLWLSAAGSQDVIAQVDVTGNSLTVLRSFDAPPDRQGTIRDLAWDGSNLWAMNSGSTTYNNPATLYKLDPVTGVVLEEYPLPMPEPRGLTYVGPNGDAYDRGFKEGFYIGETEQDEIWYFDNIRQTFSVVFPSPTPPRGDSYIFPVGLCFDGADLWLINSSSSGDYLYRIDRQGVERDRVEWPYDLPGPIVWSGYNAMTANPPTVLGASPNSGARNSAFTVTIIGSDFRPGDGLTVSFGAGITVSNVTFLDGNSLEADIDIAGDADLGQRDITVTNPDGQAGTGTGLFTVSAVDPLAGYLWLINSLDNTLYKIKILDTTLVQTWDLSPVAPGGSAQGITHNGAEMWITTGGTDDAVVNVDLDDASPSIISAVVAPPTALGVIREIAFLGSEMWVANSGTDSVYNIDPTTGNILNSIPTPGGEVRGLAAADGNLYCSDRTTDSVYVYDFGTSEWTDLFATPTPPGGDEGNRYSTGMTFDGINFWIVNSTYEFDYLFQVSLDGVVLRTYPTPLQGSATYTGVAFTQD